MSFSVGKERLRAWSCRKRTVSRRTYELMGKNQVCLKNSSFKTVIGERNLRSSSCWTSVNMRLPKLFPFLLLFLFILFPYMSITKRLALSTRQNLSFLSSCICQLSCIKMKTTFISWPWVNSLICFEMKYVSVIFEGYWENRQRNFPYLFAEVSLCQGWLPCSFTKYVQCQAQGWELGITDWNFWGKAAKKRKRKDFWLYIFFYRSLTLQQTEDLVLLPPP